MSDEPLGTGQPCGHSLAHLAARERGEDAPCVERTAPMALRSVSNPLRIVLRSAGVARLNARTSGCATKAGAFFSMKSRTAFVTTMLLNLRSVPLIRRSNKPRATNRSTIPDAVL